VSRGAGALVVALAAVLWFSLTAPYGLELCDEGRILLRSERVAEGQFPNRDFADVYGPGVTAVNGLLLELFDRRILPIRWSLVAVKATAVVALWLAALEVASPPIAGVAAAFAILTFGRASWNLDTPYAALYVLTLGAVALALLLRAASGDATRSRAPQARCSASRCSSSTPSQRCTRRASGSASSRACYSSRDAKAGRGDAPLSRRCSS
jgi:hypothetical protein